MVDFIERLGEVQEDGVDLATVVETGSEIAESGYELRLTAAHTAETVLVVIEDAVFVKMVHDRAPRKHGVE